MSARMAQGTKVTVLLIRGMRNNDCRERIAATLEGVAGVKEADVNLHRGCAVIMHEAGCQPDDLIEAVARAGYEAAVPEQR